jgi:hypothetical protein
MRIGKTLALLALLGSAGAAYAQEAKTRTIYGGPGDLAHWQTNTGKVVPSANAQEDGLNPHKSGGYIVMYDTPARDFLLDFDYKLSKGCNSGVFIRVGKASDPVMTGLEIAIDDTKGTGVHDTGALYDLVAPSTNNQKPAGEWNHMTVEARGPIVTVTVNGKKVGQVTIKDLNQKGHFGFQDHGQDCWYKNVKLTVLD